VGSLLLNGGGFNSFLTKGLGSCPNARCADILHHEGQFEILVPVSRPEGMKGTRGPFSGGQPPILHAGWLVRRPWWAETGLARLSGTHTLPYPTLPANLL